ncbi:MAG: two-component regulator propeller domain-containing protein [Paludibacter sp.]|nr:two-component regulator propeller domain-containing protein [Paludibacter sp.]
MKTHIFFLLLICTFVKLTAQEINFEHIAANNGLSQISVMTVYQDEHGYMWFGTREGLNRFDGQDIEVFLSDETDKSGLPSNIINTIIGDQNGTLYILCGYKHLVSFDKRYNRFQVIHDECQTISQGKTNLWFAVNNKIIQYNFSEKKTVDYFIVNQKYPVKKIYEASNGKLYIGTEAGLAVLDDNKVFNMVIPNNNISSIFEDSKKNIWVGTADNGVFKINRTGLINQYTHQKNTPYFLSSNIIRDFCEDNYGQIWVATFTGLDKIIPESGQIVNYKNYGDKPTDLSHTSIYALFKDKQGTIWIGTYYGGINYFNPEANIYTYFYPGSNNPKTINFPIVGKMAEDKDGNLWICTEGGGLNFYNRKDQTFKFFKANGENAIAHNNLKCIWYNPGNHKLYLGTHMGGLNIYDIKNNKFKHITTRNNAMMPNNVIEAMHPYRNKLIVLTQKGVVWLDIETETITPFFDDHKIRDAVGTQITTLTVDSKDNLWLAETDGGLKKYNLRTGQLQKYAHDFEKPGSIGRHNITRIYEDRRGRLLFSSLGSGLFQYLPDKDIFVRYSAALNGLMSDFIYDITETTYGYLFLLTNKGVNLYDPDTNKSQYLDRSRGLPLDMINVGCGIYATLNGEVFVGGINGMASFFENQITPVPKDYQLFFSEFFLNNELVNPLDKGGILKYALPYQKSMKLSYKQNNFSVKFAVSNYIKANKTLYEYKLSGLDDKWIHAKDQTISYSNLRPGSYVLHVREITGNSQSDKAKEIKLPILIAPPFYGSIAAYVFYILLIAFMLWRIIAFNKSKILLKTSLEYEIREKERIKDLNQMKLQFFTNISHEFRTPLTLIIGQIESMDQMENITPTIHNKLVKVYKNATHLRNLITELLDFRKQERDLLAIKVSNQDIVGFVKNIYQSFNDMAADRKIDYTFFSVEKNIPIWFDAVQLQKVFYNLISNAFKYSNDNSSISVRIERKSDQVKVSVSDSGVGIAEEELEKIFERFYQPKNQPGSASKVFSTGVGLALSKGIVELHHGEVKATKNKDTGTTFMVTLLIGSDHFSSEDKSVNNEMDMNNIVETELPDKLFLETILGVNDEDSRNRSTILIVEDNEEMLQFLSDIFSPIYHVETAVDGLDAIEKVKNLQPDIVLSDVMMPNMSGKELCAKLKTNFETSHIPVVLLTADSTEEQNIEGLMLGADDYITKPFNVKALISRCNNLIISRKRMQEKFFKQTDDVPVSLATNKMDQELLEKATKIVMKYIDDPEFDVSLFASEMALGRSKLYIKLKGITGMTPNNFILNIRLKTAANLLTTENELNISDITYRLGFSTPRYFSKCFKELFGLSPLHYRKANNPAFANKEITLEEEEESM